MNTNNGSVGVRANNSKKNKLTHTLPNGTKQMRQLKQLSLILDPLLSATGYSWHRAQVDLMLACWVFSKCTRLFCINIEFSIRFCYLLFGRHLLGLCFCSDTTPSTGSFSSPVLVGQTFAFLMDVNSGIYCFYLTRILHKKQEINEKRLICSVLDNICISCNFIVWFRVCVHPGWLTSRDIDRESFPWVNLGWFKAYLNFRVAAGSLQLEVIMNGSRNPCGIPINISTRAPTPPTTRAFSMRELMNCHLQSVMECLPDGNECHNT